MTNTILQWVKDELARMTAEWRKRRTTIAMETILAQMLRWRGNDGSIVDRFLREFPPELHEEFRQTLLALEKSAAAAPDPLRSLCIALVDYTEKWQVTEGIDDIMWGDGDLESQQEAQWMNELLGRRFDWVNSAATYWVSALSVRVLWKYLEFNFRGSRKPAWEDAYYDADFSDYLLWLQQQAPSRRSDAPPDDAILDEWTNRMTDKRTKDLDWFVEYYKSRPQP